MNTYTVVMADQQETLVSVQGIGTAIFVQRMQLEVARVNNLRTDHINRSVYAELWGVRRITEERLGRNLKHLHDVREGLI